MSPADGEVRQPQTVQCKRCLHQWIGFYLPMLIADAARVMGNLTCPMCAAGANQITVRMP